MKYLFLTAVSVLAVGCTTVESAKQVQAAPVAAEAEANVEAQLAAFFEDYDDQELAHSPTSKAYRGIRDADYGKWDDPSDAADIAQYERGQAALAPNGRETLSRFAATLIFLTR